MPREYYRKVTESAHIRYPFQVLWGDDGADGRRPMMMTDHFGHVDEFLRNHPTKDLDERKQLKSGLWILVTYSARSLPLSELEMLGIESGAARLKDGAIVYSDADLFEES